MSNGRDELGIRVALIDDHEVVLDGLSAWCAAADPPVIVTGVYPDPGTYLQHVQANPQDVPDTVVLDLQFGGGMPLPAIDVVAQLSDAGQKVIVYSMRTDPTTILNCLESGAATYLSKVEGRAHLIPAIHAAVTDTPYVGPRMAKAITADGRATRPTLSDREMQVLLQWFRTESKALTGKALFISEATVSTHLSRVRVKYAAAGRPATTKAALVARAVQDGLISIDEL